MLKRVFIFTFCISVIFLLSGCKSTNFIKMNMLYDYIEYEGVLYRRMINIDLPEPWDYSESYDSIYPVYVVDASMNTRKDCAYYATEIIKDKKNKYLNSKGEIIYLFFDSAEFMQNDLYPLE